MFESSPRKWFVLGSILLISALGWLIFSSLLLKPQGNLGQQAPQVGFKAPDFSLNHIDGSPFTLADQQGKVVVLNFWATWCPPCRAEMPDLQAVHDRYDKEKVLVLPVNQTLQDDLASVKAFLQQLELRMPVLLDDEGKIGRMYRVSAMPTTVFIDADGIIRKTVTGGPLAESFLATEIDKLLAEKP